MELEMPTSEEGRALLAQVAKEIKLSELGGESNRLAFIPICRKAYEIYKEDPQAVNLRLGSEENGIITLLLVKAKQEDRA